MIGGFCFRCPYLESFFWQLLKTCISCIYVCIYMYVHNIQTGIFSSLIERLKPLGIIGVYFKASLKPSVSFYRVLYEGFTTSCRSFIAHMVPKGTKLLDGCIKFPDGLLGYGLILTPTIENPWYHFVLKALGIFFPLKPSVSFCRDVRRFHEALT